MKKQHLTNQKEDKTMKKTFIKSTIILLITMVSLNAQSIYGTSSNYGGNTTYHSFSDGLTGTSSNYGGNTTYHQFNDGTYGTSAN